ncbi:unnamed protein product (macronuclear) [Paramecium tetraurelia]|uniref:Transmembrane protein n=1 Tax=Paramecium tetraurelia TaxID=5888 RepID=A0D6I7_PARTE|nr:uncharacterized protein GSPATT00001695001 [Paramecium tetraurelia]CAK78654.1 unnamed protein product [Paramecium tetraurelia]|eukprot:XP_001446051.1 hypothetical protein (macronuclear) [Paramecium tetraurelia strain d4-2]
MLDWNNSLYFTVEQIYIPASYQYSSYQSNSIKYFIIFAISSGRVTDEEVQNVFLQYLKIDTSLKTLTHYFEILTQKQKYLQQVAVTSLNYEGFWYSLEIRNDALQKSLNITYYQNSNKNIIYQKIYQNEYFAITDYFSFYLGESKISKQLGYYQFQGVIKFQLIANTTKFSPTAQSACSSSSGYAMKSQFNFTSDFYYEHTIKDLVFKSYGVTTWAKIDENKAVDNNYINVLHIQQNPNSKYQNYIGGKLAQVTYFINSTKQLIQIFYQTYTFPSLPQLSNTGDPLEKSVIYELDNQYSLFNWHYFSYSFRNNQIYLNLNFVKQNYQFIKTITSVNQFSDLMLVVHLGGTPTNRSNTSGQFNLAYFYPCLNSYTPKCHYSCSTCIGPQSNQCLSCTTSSNRQLSFDFKCICKLGYLDLSLSTCYSISTATVQDQLVPLSTSKEYDQQDPYIICSYGYFRYDDICYQCPKLKKLYFCPECIQYTNTWVYNPICTKDYQQYNQSENNTFTQDIIAPLQILLLNIEPYTVYLFNDEQLTMCAYCNSLCLTYPYSSSCLQSNYYHLQQQIMVICSQGAVLMDGECKQQCYEGCQKCDYINKEFLCLDQDPIQIVTRKCQYISTSVCKQCYDNNNYFLNMEQNDCYPCTIPNCKYCFQYLKSDFNYNSIFQHQPFVYDQEDLAVACALCQSGYAFSFFTGQCEKQLNILLGDSCSSYYINQQGKSTCLVDKDFSLSSTVYDCRQYLSQCITCTRVLQNTYYCLQCESGYYLHNNYGVCMSCIEYNPLYSECEQVQVFEPLFKIELAPFFFSLTKQYPGQQVLETLKIKVKSCISTYGIFSDTICSKSDSINCEFYDRGCRTCASTNEGTKRLTLINLKCSDCPYFCEYCKPREIQDIYLINPYTNVTATLPELTYRCIQKSSIHKTVFFDNRIQLVRICSQEIPKCELYHIQKFTNLKTFYSAMISLSTTNALQYYNLRGSSGFSFFINSSATYLMDNSFFSLYDIPNNYISQIVSLKYTKFTYFSQSISYALIFGKLRFLNFQEIQFIQTSILFSLTQSSQLIFESLGSINLLFENCIIEDSNTTFSYYNQIFDVSISSRSYQIAVQNPYRINFTNVIISNISLLNTTFLNLTTVNKQINQLDYIYFQNVTFFNCSFSQTNIINLLEANQYKYISIIQLSFIDCNFSKSYFIHTFGLQLKGKFILQNLVMKNCFMRNSALITIPVTITTTINDLHLQSVQFYDTDFIQVSSSAFIQNIIVQDSKFSNSKIIHKIKSLISSAKEEYLIENLQIFDCYYQELNIVLMPQYSIEDIKVTLRSIQTQSLHSLNYYLNMDYPLFQFQVAQIIIEDIKLIRQPGSKDFIIKGCEYVSISDVQILSNLVQISSDSSELIQQTLNTIFIVEAQQLKLENIHVQNQLSVNVIFFYFNLIKLQDSQDCYLRIQNIQLDNIQLIKQQFSEISTIFYITSLIAQNISISESQFNGIFLNEFVQDTKISSAAIAVIVSEQSNIKLENNLINDVVVLNSSNSIFLIQTQYTILENITSVNVNHFQSYINKYKQKLLMQFDLINAHFLINSYGGLYNFLTQNLIIFSCHFENSVGLWGGVLSITTKFFGLIDIQQTIFINMSTNVHKSQEGRGGSIFINSENSYLNLTIKNTQFLNSTSGLEGGVMYIKPSQYQCYLKLQNVTFKDVFAVHYSAIFFQIIESNFDQISSIELFNIEIENQLLQFISFLKAYSIDLTDSKINEQSALFSLRNFQIYLNGLKVTGFFIQPILYITYVKCLFMDKLILYNITSLYSPLIYIENMPQHKSALLIKSTLITSFNELDQSLIKKYSQIENINLSNLNFESLLEIVLNTNLTSAQVVSLNMQNNNCKTCQSGLVNINNKQVIKKVRLINLYFFQNSCGLGSCLFLNSLISEIFHFLSQSIFCYNSAQTGGAIQLTNFRLKIHQTFFLSNVAFGSGGAIYYQTSNQSQLLQFKYVSFVNNQAQIGGAIYDKNKYSLDSVSFQLINNKAHYFANNLATEPTQLSLLINNKPTNKKSIMVENKTIQIISYLNDSKLTKFIYMPSGVSLNSYQKFNMKTSAYSMLNYNYTLQAVNCFNEQIYDLKQTQCQLKINQIQKNKSQEISRNSEIKELIFDEEEQSYDLKDQVFTLDPYQNDSYYLQIDTSCNSFSTKDYYLRFFVKTYHCQIGEYFENNKCLKCDSLQGYYSVELKSTQCNRMNIQMIKSTTGAMIELQPGYWRPFFKSNKIEQCKKYPNRCLGGWDVSDNSCFIGSFGALCEECDLFNLRGQGSYLNNKESVCQSCGKFSVQLIFMVLESIWIILLIILTVRSNNLSNKQLFKLKCIYRHYQTIYKQMMDQTSTLIKMANNNFQILSLISTLQISIFSSLSNFVIFLGDSTYIITYQLDCSIPSIATIQYEYAHFIIVLLLPLFHFGSCCFVFLIFLVKKYVTFSKSYIYSSIIYIYCLNLQNIMKWGVSLITKRQLSGIDWIQANVASRYDTETHSLWSKRFIYPILILLGVLIPAFLFVQMKKIRKSLDDRNSIQKFSFLYNEYTDKSYYWEIIKMLQKISIILIVNYFEQSILIKGIFMFLIVLIYYKLCLEIQPYKLQSISQIDCKISFLLSITLICSVLLYVIQQEDLFYLSYATQIIIVFLIYKQAEFLLRRILIVYVQRLNLQLDKLRQEILFRFPRIYIQYVCLRPYLMLRKEQQERIQLRFKKIRQYIKTQQRYVKEKNIYFSHTQRESSLIGSYPPTYNSSRRLYTGENGQILKSSE